MTLPDFPELGFTDDGLIYQQTEHIDYDSIEAITFKLAALLQNRLSRAFYGIDTSSVFGSSSETPKFGLHLADGKTIWLNKGWDFAIPTARVEAICAAAELLHQKTFDRRFDRYKKQFESEGRFSYGQYQFCRNGDILKSGTRLYNVSDNHFSIVLGQFHIHFERKATALDKLRSLLGQSGHTIDISRDRDCFLSMYRLAYGTYWTDEDYRDHPGG